MTTKLKINLLLVFLFVLTTTMLYSYYEIRAATAPYSGFIDPGFDIYFNRCMLLAYTAIYWICVFRIYRVYFAQRYVWRVLYLIGVSFVYAVMVYFASWYLTALSWSMPSV